MQAVDLAVQIVNYKTKSFLEPLIRSILTDLADSGLTFEISILDNASGDDLGDITQKWSGRGIHLYISHKNGGFGAGHNQLARKTAARYLLVLNPDTLFVEPGSIRRLLDTLEQHGAAVVGPRLLNPSRQKRSSALGQLAPDQLTRQRWDHGVLGLSKWRPRTTHELQAVAWVSGAVFLIERALFVKVGGFDEKFFLYCEEVDLCLRLRQRHETILYDPSVQILHQNGAVAKKFSRYGLYSVFYFLRKHPAYLFSRQ